MAEHSRSVEMEPGNQVTSDEPIRARNVLRILTAAVEIFSRKGLDGARIVEIAKASGLPKGNVYYYFSSKEEIYNAAIDRLIHSWDDAFRHISADREPAEAIEAYVRAKLNHAWENAAETRLFANEILQGAEHLSKDAREHMRKVTAEKARVINAWAASGKIVPVDARHLFILLWSATQFYVEFEALACDALDVNQLIEADYANAAKTITNTILRGLLIIEA
ncbi:TetR/AcrR family transcriptional regulator [Brucella pseudogrignonensis]|uniref:TetR/AcrR family transcriptional regulator n=1 Tax=Brucella pseudogrignonensis TaxID=419475 RepID=UPI0028B3A086|nr:TetR/AcrR family transcriptional regulator [Brucella pseudogrignonensis]MDT6942097.1 TetR/AcrR family transcriptional regulator [Brucella pseudogrignonensis]